MSAWHDWLMLYMRRNYQSDLEFEVTEDDEQGKRITHDESL
jgi:hypothetical protein